MVTRAWADRSRSEQYQRCKRSRWLGYHEAGIGIAGKRKPLPLAVGGAVHAGLAVLLRDGQKAMVECTKDSLVDWKLIEEDAVAAALADFAEFDAGRLELDLSETNAIDTSTFTEEDATRVRSELDQYLYEEQSALVEGMVRAYARRRLRPLLEEFEVLEVEREGSWVLHESEDRSFDGESPTSDIVFMSRPDTLLRERSSNSLYIESYKTAASWDVRKERDAQHDSQGLSEGVEIEKRLAEWWKAAQMLKNGLLSQNWHAASFGKPMLDFLMSLPEPPRILGIRYEYMFKGDRRRDKDLGARLGIEVRTQSSVLTRGFLNQGMTTDDASWNWSWDYVKETGESSKLYWKAWKGVPVHEHMTTKAWIDRLDATVETVGEEGASRGWSGPAQATGFTTEHPLDSIFHPPLTIYRNDDDLRDWIEQIEAQEVQIAHDVACVELAKSDAEKRSELNVRFPQSRRQCEYPSSCEFVKICYGGADIRRDPLASGLYELRKVNHPQEIGGDVTTEVRR